MAFMQKYDAESEEPGDFRLYCRFVVGSTGAIGTISKQSQHIASVSRTATATYKFVLDHPFFSQPALPGGVAPSPLLGHSVKVIGSVTTTDGTIGHVTVDNSANQDASGTAFITVSFTAGADGTAADVKSGNEVSVSFNLKAHP